MSSGLHLSMVSEASNGAVSDIGALLRASRIRRGEGLRDVADQLRIRFVHLEAIEDGRFENLPGATYAIGFIRTYAEQAGDRVDAAAVHAAKQMYFAMLLAREGVDLRPGVGDLINAVQARGLLQAWSPARTPHR